MGCCICSLAAEPRGNCRKRCLCMERRSDACCTFFSEKQKGIRFYLGCGIGSSSHLFEKQCITVGGFCCKRYICGGSVKICRSILLLSTGKYQASYSKKRTKAPYVEIFFPISDITQKLSVKYGIHVRCRLYSAAFFRGSRRRGFCADWVCNTLCEYAAFCFALLPVIPLCSPLKWQKSILPVFYKKQFRFS